MLEALAAHLDAISALVPTWGYLLIFVFMAIESSFIPFPSEVVMIPAGFFVARGLLPSATIAVIVAIIGSLAGAYVNYFLSMWLGRPFLEKYGKYFFVKKEHLDRSYELFNRYGEATTFLCRLIPVIRQLISIPAGISRMPLKSFTFYTALGAGIWAALLTFIGWVLGKTAGDLSYLELIERGKTMISSNLPLVILGAVVLVVMHMVLKRLIARKTKC